MSKIKVNRLENTSTASGGIDIDSSGHVKVDGLQLPTTGALSNRNILINGDMRVAQRSTSAVTNVLEFSANIKYDAIDRWGYWAAAASKFTVQQVADAPAGFSKSLKITSSASTTHGATDGYAISQRVEVQNLYGAGLGTADAKNLVASFWVKSTSTGTFSFYAHNPDFDNIFVQNFTINAAETWEYKTISIPGPTSGTWNSGTPNGSGLELGFALGAGSDRQTTTLGSWHSSTWKISSTTAVNVLGVATRTLQFTGVQLELGDKPTEFEHRSISDELARCQRYTYKLTKYAGNNAYPNVGLSSGTCTGNVSFPVTMRSTPSLDSGTTVPMTTDTWSATGSVTRNFRPGLDSNSLIFRYYSSDNSNTLLAVNYFGIRGEGIEHIFSAEL